MLSSSISKVTTKPIFLTICFCVKSLENQWRILGVLSVRLHPGGSKRGAKKEGRKRKKQGKGEKKGKEKGRQRRREGKGKKICKRKGKEGRNQKKIGYKKKNTRVATHE